MWIEKSDKTFYNESKLKGIRLLVNKNISKDIKEEIKSFLVWLRKRYFFPIRCKIIIKNNSYFLALNEKDKDSYGDFYYEDESYPEIWIAGGTLRNEKKENRIRRIVYMISHELTHYFQWFFYEFEKRTNRSLEIEANRWARYLLQEYFDSKDLI